MKYKLNDLKRNMVVFNKTLNEYIWIVRTDLKTGLILYLRMNDENTYGRQFKDDCYTNHKEIEKYETGKKITIKHEKTIKK